MESSRIPDEYKNAQTERIIERLAFPSGGSRYVFLFGVYAALYKSGLLKNVKQVAGTSAGAMIATMAALGADPNEIYKKYGKIDLLSLFGDFVGSLWGNPEGITPITRDGKPLVAKLREIITSIMREFFASDEAQLMLDKHAGLNDLASRFENADPRLSSHDLAMLNELFPSRFKQLFFETVICPTGETHILETISSHHDIAEGCYAAGAVPGVLAPMEINGNKLIDGGVYRQMPFDAFDFPLPNQKPLNTLVFIFTDPPYETYENTSSFKALYKDQVTTKFFDPHYVEKLFRDYLMPSSIGLYANYSNTESWDKNYADLASNYALNTVEINACGLLQPNFPQAVKYSRQFYASGFLDTMNYLTNHELCMSECEAELFYKDVLCTFECIYKAITTESNRDLEHDSFWTEFIKYKCNPETEKVNTAKNCCLFLHDHLKRNLDSISAIALSYAVEFVNDVLSADELFKDCYQFAFEQSGIFKRSNILGYPVYRSESLRNGWNSFSLFNINNNQHGDKTLHILDNLLKIPKFKHQYQADKTVSINP